MKVKDLIGILQVCNPESEVQCRWLGDCVRDIKYRQACSWLVINKETQVGTGTDALQSFSIIGADIEDAKEQGMEGLECTLSLDQDYYVDSHVMETVIKINKSGETKK